MTPEETKAKEFVDNFQSLLITMKGCNEGGNPCIITSNMYLNSAKQCALICVDEIINSSPSLPILSDNVSFGSDIVESTKYWFEVKESILKL